MSTLHTIAQRTKKLPPLRVGIGGPVGSGKTTLLEMLCKAMRERYDLVAITNDIYTKEDQRLLPELSDLTIYVIDVAAGEKIPRKGGPGITKSDLFVINKTDLAPYVGADLSVMEADTIRMRTNTQGLKPFVMTNLRTLTGLQVVVDFIVTKGMLPN